jgi:hypothetical protein
MIEDLRVAHDSSINKRNTLLSIRASNSSSRTGSENGLRW